MLTSIYTKTNYRKNLEIYWRQFYPEWSIPEGYHVHHIKPISCGGSHHPSNLIALHPDDHQSIHRCRGDGVCVGYMGILGRKHSEVTKEKMSISKKGKLAEDIWGRERTIELKQQASKLGESWKGKKRSADNKKKISSSKKKFNKENNQVNFYEVEWNNGNKEIVSFDYIVDIVGRKDTTIMCYMSELKNGINRFEKFGIKNIIKSHREYIKR